MKDIKLFVCCHQQTLVPAHPLLVPIQVGATLADVHFPGFLRDDVGNHISHKNRSYCELTAQYWAWKNVRADYYGFFHYRRYLYPNREAKRPYRVEREPAPQLLDKLGYAAFGDLISQYDLILPKGEDMHIPVREHYAQAQFHHRKDLELAERIVLERNPEMKGVAEAYLLGTVCCFGNIFIMRRQIFHEYCAWLFPLLEEFDGRADTTGYNRQEKRVDGYLAERLFGIWTAHMSRGLRTLELPRVHFCSGKDYIQRKALNAVLPPGSWRRAWAKQIRGS